MIVEEIINSSIARIRKIRDKDYKKQVLKRFDSLKDFLDSKLLEIYNRIPGKKINRFYRELLDLYIGWENVLYAKRRINFIRKKVFDFYNLYRNRVRILRDRNEISKVGREFYGRVFSLLRRNKKAFLIYSEIEKFYRRIPKIKDLPTIVITGLPNVGKSTLLKKLTGSEPEIQPYPFTTKDIMVGYIRSVYSDIQVLDVPGIMDREFDRMNRIEKRAILALKYLANLIVYVIDLTETCGYSVKEQENVLRRIKDNFNLDIVIYFSKTDLFSDNEWKKMEDFVNRNKLRYFYDKDELVKYIIGFIKEKKLFV
ncbi:GTP-binding protein [Nanoarchaeota archaeon NZ13-N]|nr:MAG: GTP-binding protein [Nanoarchaeota archaeon NZ13-N]